jgi:hypothetical protein
MIRNQGCNLDFISKWNFSPNLSRIKFSSIQGELAKIPTGITLIEIANTYKITIQHRAKTLLPLAEQPHASQSKSIAAASCIF